MNTSTAGKAGETAAAAVLEKAGLRIIARNIQSQYGEVDIVALDGETVVFIEVKTRSTLGIESLEYSVDTKKQRRIIGTAECFLYQHEEFADAHVRFDIVFIGREGVTHLQNAFGE